MRLLLIEDDEDILRALALGLRKSGYAVDTAEDGEEGLAYLEINGYDLVVLDLNLPQLDGMTVLRRLRAVNRDIKVLILSARWSVEDKVLGLDEGANDYLVKPFHFAELEARVRALLARQFSQGDTVLSLGRLCLDTAAKTAAVAGEPLTLTAKEYAILAYLLRRPGETVSAEELLEHVWDSEADLFSNAIKVHISALRKKLTGCCRIGNVRGLGYRLEADNEG